MEIPQIEPNKAEGDEAIETRSDLEDLLFDNVFGKFKVLLVSAGAGGTLTVKDVRVPKSLGWKIAIDNACDLSKIPKGKYTLRFPLAEFGAGMDPAVSRRLIQGKISLLDRAVDTLAKDGEPKIVVLVAAVGHGTGSGSILPIVNWARKKYGMNAVYVVVLVVPLREAFNEGDAVRLVNVSPSFIERG